MSLPKTLDNDAGPDTPLANVLAANQAGDHAAADRLMRHALAALVQLQSQAPADALPRLDAAQWADALALFPVWCVQRRFAITWTDTQQQTWQRVCGLLVASALAQPVVALRDGSAGPVTQDLAALLRAPGASWDETQELDWAVRWWQQARAAGVPVDTDFGEVWRAQEWLALLHRLVLIGQVCQQQQQQSSETSSTALPPLVAGASRVALRYGPLKPLLRLLEPMADAPVEAGFTF